MNKTVFSAVLAAALMAAPLMQQAAAQTATPAAPAAPAAIPAKKDTSKTSSAVAAMRDRQMTALLDQGFADIGIGQASPRNGECPEFGLIASVAGKAPVYSASSSASPARVMAGLMPPPVPSGCA